MQIDARPHFEMIVLPAIEAYNQADAHLTHTVLQNDSEVSKTRAQYGALREGGAAAFYLHHFSDIIAHRSPPGVPNFQGSVKEARKWLANFSVAHLGDSQVELLGDIADALKHAVLTQKLPREVEEAGQVLTTGRGYGTGPYGAGKYGGVDEVWVLGHSGARPLSNVLNSVSRAWEMALAGELRAIPTAS